MILVGYDQFRAMFIYHIDRLFVAYYYPIKKFYSYFLNVVIVSKKKEIYRLRSRKEGVNCGNCNALATENKTGTNW